MMRELLKRKGIFKISGELIKENPDEVIKVLSGVLIVGVENDFMTNTLKYKGYSNQFKLVEEGERIPNYLAIINKDKVIAWKEIEEN